MTITFKTTNEVSKDIANRVREIRLSFNLTQKTLSERSGVSYAVLKKFELTGRISLESLLKIALSLGVLLEFENIFITKKEKINSLDDLLISNNKKQKERQRGRK